MCCLPLSNRLSTQKELNGVNHQVKKSLKSDQSDTRHGLGRAGSAARCRPSLLCWHTDGVSSHPVPPTVVFFPKGITFLSESARDNRGFVSKGGSEPLHSTRLALVPRPSCASHPNHSSCCGNYWCYRVLLQVSEPQTSPISSSSPLPGTTNAEPAVMPCSSLAPGSLLCSGSKPLVSTLC